MLRVAVDATGWSNRRGFGRFTRNAVRALAARDDVVLELLVDRGVDADALPPGAVVQRLPSHGSFADTAAQGSRRRLVDLWRAGALVRSLPVDVVLFPSLHTWFPVRGLPTVVGVHDATARRLPRLVFGSRAAQLAWEAKERAALRSATRVFTVSEAARAEVAEVFGLDRAAVAVVPEAPDPVFASPPAGDALVRALAALGLEPDGYVLCAPGGLAPHKDVASVVRAYAAAAFALEEPLPPLVVVAALDGETFHSEADRLRALVVSLGLEELTTFTGFVPDAALAALYAGAVCVVNASRAEGFGLPAVEAASCGAALVLSDLPAHRETVGDAAVLVGVGDVDALARALVELASAPERRRALGSAARAAVADASWDVTADRLVAVLGEAAHEL